MASEETAADTSPTQVLHYSSAQVCGGDGRLRAAPVASAEDQARACTFEVKVLDGYLLGVGSHQKVFSGC